MRARTLIVACLATFTATAASAADLETLVMPGPLIAGHAEIESDCTSCHKPFEPKAENALCIVCHEDVGNDLAQKRGFHGLSPGANGPCRTCHTDHEGRDADIVGLDASLFAHDATDYPLRGAHRAIACGSCHPSTQKHRDAPVDCVGCHEKNDPHRGGLGTDCGDCHSEITWAKAEFDHGTTPFALEGAHADTACSTCHADERWKETPSDCVSCHKVDDVHVGRFGSDCQSCHGVAEWKTVSFDHDRDTEFALTGKHRSASCTSCHPGQLFDRPTPKDCLSCHGNDDVHRGGNGPKCGQCHDTRAWVKVTFEHDRDTDFPLSGSHASASCESCHADDPYQNPTPSDCISCHRADDAHANQLGGACGACHGEKTWQQDVRFDHELSRFPLLGLHATAACESCHESARFGDAKTACLACHRPDDAHDRKLGTACQTCHNPNAWGIWKFDHATQTDFALHGAHEGVDCTSCHQKPAVHPIGQAVESDCRSCHASKDVHRGSFGPRCESCHNASDWEQVSIEGR